MMTNEQLAILIESYRCRVIAETTALMERLPEYREDKAIPGELYPILRGLFGLVHEMDGTIESLKNSGVPQ